MKVDGFVASDELGIGGGSSPGSVRCDAAGSGAAGGGGAATGVAEDGGGAATGGRGAAAGVAEESGGADGSGGAAGNAVLDVAAGPGTLWAYAGGTRALGANPTTATTAHPTAPRKRRLDMGPHGMRLQAPPSFRQTLPRRQSSTSSRAHIIDYRHAECGYAMSGSHALPVDPLTVSFERLPL